MGCSARLVNLFKLETVQKAIALVEELFSPRLIVVKSMELFASLAYGDGQLRSTDKQGTDVPYTITYM